MSDTCAMLEGEKEKCSKLQIKASVNGGNNSNCPVTTCMNGVTIALLSPTYIQ